MLPNHTAILPARLEDTAALGALHVATWQETYAGIMPAAFLAEMDPVARAAKWAAILEAGHHGVFLARQQEALVGFCAVGPSRGDLPQFHGELGAIYTRKSVHGTGVGAALLDAGFAWMEEQQLVPFFLWVLEANPQARRFYERKGGRPCGAKMEEVGGMRLRHIAYGWGV